MKNKEILTQLAPTLATAMDGPFAGVATKYIQDGLSIDTSGSGSPAAVISELLNDPVNLEKLKRLDTSFDAEMKKLNVDVYSVKSTTNKAASQTSINLKPQAAISALFLVSYFLMLGAIFTVEISDTLNMKQGENSLMGELQILFGVLTAGVGQILSFWFGGILNKKDNSPAP